MRTIEREVVGAVLISEDGKVLLGKTAAEAGGVYSGSWVIPGGGINPGESKKEALVREILEETHHDISRCRLQPIEHRAEGQSRKKLKETGETVMVKMSFNDYLVRLDRTAAQLGTEPSEELVELRWFDRDELNAADLSPPTEALFKKLDLKD